MPENWTWARLADLVTKLTDGTHHSPPNGPDGECVYISAKNIKPEGVRLDDVTYVSAAVHDEIYARCNPEKGDILYVKDGATTGVATINNIVEPFSMLSSVALLKLPSCIDGRLLLAFLRSPFFYNQMRGYMKGSALPRVTLNRMAPALVPVPPLAEQRRIVAKVDELMALCDELEHAQAEREQRRARLAAASLRALDTADAVDRRDRVPLGLRGLSRSLGTPDLCDAAREAIRALAVRGRLVAPDPSDVEVEPLLRHSDTRRAKAATGNSPRRSAVQAAPR